MQKRALIVDDSKSARVVLSRMLEKYDLQVHAAESAEDAIAHLQAERPDVIFMDHLMPSMDGFQAVQAIKNDPRTATIPILMYTSQGGELYIGQARALGAIGVLPKQLGLTDVAKVLHQLHLLPERRPDSDTEPQQGLLLAGEAVAEASPPVETATEVPAATAADGAPITPAPAGAAAPAAPPSPVLTERLIRETVEPLLSAQSAELRRFILATVDGHTPFPSAERATPEPPIGAEGPPAAGRPTGWIAAACLCALLAAGAAYTAWQAHAQLAIAQSQLAAAVAATAAAAPAPSVEAPAPTPESVPPQRAVEPGAPAARQVLAYAYGELPLAGARLEALRTLVGELSHRGAAGTVHLTSYAADFCLTGNPAEGYLPAPDDMPANRCDVVGNPFDEGLRGAQRESRAFADFVTTLSGAGPTAITALVHHVAHSKAPTAYPPAGEATASAWNQAALANQYVEMRFEPRLDAPAP